jgi:hypothetical protein
MTPPTELVITLPLPPSMANARVHWRVKNRQRVAYFEHCDVLHRIDKGIGFPPSLPERSARLGFTLYCANRHDDDNALSRCKFATDWLVKRGYLVDDAPKFCRMSIPEQVITRDKAKQRLEIVIRYEEPQ